LVVHPGARISSLGELIKLPLLRGIDFKRILAKKTNPPFKPKKNHLNCDPSLELEEMIVEQKPLHKKKKRLAKQRSMIKDHSIAAQEDQFIKEFIVYNRYKELKRKAMEVKEMEWQKELDSAMANSEVNSLMVAQHHFQHAQNLNSQPDEATTSHTLNSPDKTETIDFIDSSPSVSHV
jgi:serine/threonine kinase 32